MSNCDEDQGSGSRAHRRGATSSKIEDGIESSCRARKERNNSPTEVLTMSNIVRHFQERIHTSLTTGRILTNLVNSRGGIETYTHKKEHGDYGNTGNQGHVWRGEEQHIITTVVSSHVTNTVLSVTRPLRTGHVPT